MDFYQIITLLFSFLGLMNGLFAAGLFRLKRFYLYGIAGALISCGAVQYYVWYALAYPEYGWAAHFGAYFACALMAADILLYQPDYVPVGEDQKQHVELCRNIVQRFNGIYGDVFKMPEPYIPKVGARVMSLSDPGAKMSKSDKDPNGSIYLMEKPEDILRKFKRAVTDSDTENCVRYDPTNKPGVANLMTIYSAVTGKSFDEIEQEFAGKGYGAFKPAVGEAVVETLRPIREEATRILGDKAYLESVYRAGAQKASYVAEKTLRKVYKKVGFVAR